MYIINLLEKIYNKIWGNILLIITTCHVMKIFEKLKIHNIYYTHSYKIVNGNCKLFKINVNNDLKKGTTTRLINSF